MQTAVWAGFLLLFSVQDIRKQEISLLSVAIAAVSGIVLYRIFPFSLYSLAGGLGTGALLLLAAVCSRGRIGIGDGLLALLCGLFLGFRGSVSVLIFASFLAAGTAAVLMVRSGGEKTKSFPFAPCLLMAVILHIFLQMTIGKTFE